MNFKENNKSMNDLILAKAAARQLLNYSDKQINSLLLKVADEIEANIDTLLEANAKDLERMDPADPKYDRLKLTPDRLRGIANDMRHVAELPSPLGVVQQDRTLPNGLHLQRVSVPFGVIGVIYEARPNVTFDVFGLCVKAGSACVLKGGSDAMNSNRAAVDLIKNVLIRERFPEDAVTLLTGDHEVTRQMLDARGLVDVIIPRGGRKLIDYVRENAKVPVIETGAGVCHTYFDASGDLEMGKAIINNAKTRRVSVCNALDCLIIHRDRLNDLSKLCAPLAKSQVVIYADDLANNALKDKYPFLEYAHDEEIFGTEFMDYKMAIRAVDNIDQALEHIAKYGSGHSEAIIADDTEAALKFQQMVDAACVYHNAPTSFTDGAQFGLGAEIGISTQKLHARGPMGLAEITTYKWLISGNGQIRPK